MPFRDTETLLRDIAYAIGMIERFTAQMDFDAFREDPKTIAAVERKLQIISEAAIRPGASRKARFRALNGARFGVSETGYGISMSGLNCRSYSRPSRMICRFSRPRFWGRCYHLR